MMRREVSNEAAPAVSILSKLEISLREAQSEMAERKTRCEGLRDEEALRFVEYANHRCVTGELDALGREVLAGSDLATLVSRDRESLAGFYRQIESTFDPEAISLIKNFDQARAAVFILQAAIQQQKRIIAEAEARKSSLAEQSRAAAEARRSSLIGKFRAAAHALKLW